MTDEEDVTDDLDSKNPNEQRNVQDDTDNK